MTKLVVTKRSRNALKNTIDYMKQNKHHSSIIVAGDHHLPTIKVFLRELGYEPFKPIEYTLP